ncbi:MAG: sulfur carrier protein ThiS [Thiocapsa sp.]|nr:sulfur carrier protein ThiS [Thiocapsa sp.]MCG6895726.1 sulfur carrier protein ThiS [Thiocapsa sp.]MCG6984067.1 sulfur carrier protein ThiS [Thiocapsa sp.]
MQIILNGAATEVFEGISMAELINELQLANRRLAVEVNAELVPRSQFQERRLQPQDRVEIIHAVGGG